MQSSCNKYFHDSGLGLGPPAPSGHANGVALTCYALYLTGTNKVPAFCPLSFTQEGHTGVVLFMMQSDFIFQTLYRNREVNYFEFIRNRLLRIAPL